MSKADDLKKYFIGSEKSFLVSPVHNGKTSMLSGEWGTGKTFFWQKEIQPELSKTLKKKNKACVYVSLYGKDNLEAVKSEILYKAYNFFATDTDDLIEKSIAVFSLGSKVLSSFSFWGISVDPSAGVESMADAKEAKKLLEGQNYLSNGGVVCLDDFERKSKNIDLNDLFGFISQLSIEINCKVVIILNSEVFKGEEKEVFKTVKEKTVNKYFSFAPSIKDLFEVIFNDEKYTPLIKYKEKIVDIIKEADELNARIYIQVLDNCLEWILAGKSDEALRSLILCTINFIKNHFVFDTFKLQGGHTTYKVIEPFMEYAELGIFLKNKMPVLEIGSDEIIHYIKAKISNQKNNSDKKSPDYYERQNKMLMNNKETVKAFYHNLYILKINNKIDSDLFEQINNFVKSGILV